MSAESPLQLELHTTVLRVGSLEASRNFYETKLDMHVIYEDVRYKLITLEKNGGNRVSLWELREHEQRTYTAKESAYMVFFSRDAIGTREELIRRGVEVGEIEEYPFGLRLFWLSDPDKFQFCVIEFLPE